MHKYINETFYWECERRKHNMAYEDIRVGDKVWVFDINRRMYIDPDGNKLNSPWYRGHFVERYIIGETRVSWIVGYTKTTNEKHGFKIKKKEANDKLYLNEKQINNACWIHKNKYKIKDKINYCNDYETLKQIDDLLTLKSK